MEAEMLSESMGFIHNWHGILPEKNLSSSVTVKALSLIEWKYARLQDFQSSL
jgi:hypothetical protein